MENNTNIKGLKDCEYHLNSKDNNKKGLESTLFITADMSTSGSFIISRDKETQALFSIKGKPINYLDKDYSEIKEGYEISDLIKALGIQDGIKGLKYKKIIIATSKAPEDLQVQNLLFSFFLTHFKELVINGHLYLLEMPQFIVNNNTEKIFCYNESDKTNAIKVLSENNQDVKVYNNSEDALGIFGPKDFKNLIGKDMRLISLKLDNMHGVSDLLNCCVGKRIMKQENYFKEYNSLVKKENNSNIFKIMLDNFYKYSRFIIENRINPDIDDGFKTIQRQILWVLLQQYDGNFHKVANVIGGTMGYIPRTDIGISSQLYQLIDKRLLIDTDREDRTPRYLGCKLSSLAKETLFNNDITQFGKSYLYEKKMPITLPSKLPVLLLQGTDGAGLGLTTQIFSHNFEEVLNAQISILRNQSYEIYPDFISGGIIDVRKYKRGKGSISIKAKIDIEDDKLIIKELPHGISENSLIDSIENAINRSNLNIKSIKNYSTKNIDIVIENNDTEKPELFREKLYKYTDCEIVVHSSINVLCDNKTISPTVNELLEYNTKKLVEYLDKELTIEIEALEKDASNNSKELLIAKTNQLNINEYAIRYIEKLLFKYKDNFTRKSKIENL